ncbi:MAG TPA: NUDIX domain-containing protein [Mycobacteriales bacterium]|nr:NUDIX domain-containing protein [Mycobacteriales bacterium]
MPVRSAGILLWRRAGGDLEVLIAHMGGPYWAGKDAAAWSIPKGEYAEDEQPLAAALREFTEELGLAVPVQTEQLVPLGELRQPSGKRLTVWAGEADLDVAAIRPGAFTMPWPRGSATLVEFPEVDGAEWCSVEIARDRLTKGQRPFLDRLVEMLDKN